MQIKDLNLNFNGTLNIRSQTKRIIIHHTATDGDVSARTVHKWHLSRGWSGIGYHYLIRTDGTIERGRPENTIGAHAGAEANVDSIGIALAGNFMRRKPESVQIEALIKLINDINSRYGKLDLLGHCHVSATACPGELFPMEQVRRMVDEGGNSMPAQWKLDLVTEAMQKGLLNQEHNPDENADKWFVLAVALNLLRIVENQTGDSN